MYDTFLIITFFLLASVLVCLLTLRFSINIKHCVIFHSLPILTNFLKFQPPFYFDPPLPRLLNLRKISDPPPRLFWPLPPFIRHLRLQKKLFYILSTSRSQIPIFIRLQLMDHITCCKLVIEWPDDLSF